MEGLGWVGGMVRGPGTGVLREEGSGGGMVGGLREGGSGNGMGGILREEGRSGGCGACVVFR